MEGKKTDSLDVGAGPKPQSKQKHLSPRLKGGELAPVRLLSGQTRVSVSRPVCQRRVFDLCSPFVRQSDSSGEKNAGDNIQRIHGGALWPAGLLFMQL